MPRSDDEGVTLVELIVYLAVGALILALMAGLLVNGLKSQAQTTDRDTATGRATIITNSIQTSVRNASAVTVSPDGKSLVAVVATGTTGWECRAWTVTSTGAMLYKSAAAKITVPLTAGTALASGVAPISSTPVFAQAGSQVTVQLTVTAGAAVVPVTSGATAQALIVGAGPCW